MQAVGCLGLMSGMVLSPAGYWSQLWRRKPHNQSSTSSTTALEMNWAHVRISNTYVSNSLLLIPMGEGQRLNDLTFNRKVLSLLFLSYLSSCGNKPRWEKGTSVLIALKGQRSRKCFRWLKRHYGCLCFNCWNSALLPCYATKTLAWVWQQQLSVHGVRASVHYVSLYYFKDDSFS